MADRPSVVAVTGAAGYVGRRLLAELDGREELRELIAIDVRPLPGTFRKVVFYQRDVAQPLDDLLHRHGVDTVVHLAFVLRPGYGRREVEAIRRANVGGMESVLRACRAAGVSTIIYFSSHTVYGAHPDNPIPITEEAPVRPTEGFQYSLDKALCEGRLRAFMLENPDVTVGILRGCVVMGPMARNFVTQAFFKPILVGIRGYDPPLQFVHEEDVARLMTLFILEPRRGIYNVGGEGTIPYSRMARLARRRLVFLPAGIAYPLTQMAWALRLQRDSPAAGLDFIRYPIVVSTEKLKRETDFQFRYTSEEALMSFLSASLSPAPTR